MTTPGAETKDRILQAAYRLFYRAGFSRVSMDAIAEAAGVTKRTVYYHFTSKDDVVAEVMEGQHQHLMSEFESWLETPPESASELITCLFDRLETWAERPGWLGSGFTRVSAELADLKGHPARKAAHRHKRAVEGWIADQLGTCGVVDAPQMAAQLMTLIEGAMSLALIHGDARHLRSARAAALRLAANPAE